MSELTFRSPGISTREIDISQPSSASPSGVPAGIIGIADKGPAFVPFTFANFNDFVDTFGELSADKFGAIAVNEWLRSANACTFIRVLGIGDGKKRNADGTVTNAGFKVGDRIIQTNGQLDNNTYANSGEGAAEGRLYFLGCFMSESNGSTIFSDAGIQKTTVSSGVKATASFTFDDKPNETTLLTLTDAEGTVASFEIDDDGDGVSAGAVAVTDIAENGGGAVGTAIDLVAKINADAIKITASRDGNTVTLTQDIAGKIGNKAITSTLTSIAFDPNGSMPTVFTGGVDGNHAIPILRGILMAPSGVILHLSGNSHGAVTTQGSAAPLTTNTARTNDDLFMGRSGCITGSVDLRSGKQEFTILMNGFNGLNDQPTHLTASFDPLASNYMSRVLNTDPLKIEEKGHLLYNHYPIHGNIAKVTGSGVVSEGHMSRGTSNEGAYSSLTLKEDISFLLTSSIGRGASSSTVPDYENFQDRFSHAETPYVISQQYGGTYYDLFKVVALSAGAGFADDFKFSIENINKGKDDNTYGTFDLIVRDGYDSDSEKRILEAFRGLTLDSSDTNYIGRIIGDQNIKFNFDVSLSSQKIIAEGNHPNRSKYIRVKLSNALLAGNVPITALPFGHRGPKHLLTSGSYLAREEDSLYAATDILQRIKEPPVFYRKNISDNTGLAKVVDAKKYWGIQNTMQVKSDDPNFISFNEQIVDLQPVAANFQKFFPDHSTATKMWQGDNPNAAEGLNSDTFNYNLFSLNKIKVRTGSNSDATVTTADPTQWISASYVRSAPTDVISSDDDLKTRGFTVDDLEVPGNVKYAKFTFFAQGGFDGVNIFSKEKRDLTNNAAKYEIDNSSTQGGTSGPTISAYRKALDIMGSKTDVDIKVLSNPGIRNSIITDYGISVTENRFDCLYVMDIEERDQANKVVTASIQNVHIANTIKSFKNRNVNSSFASAYFPDINMTLPGTNNTISVPPSVGAIGALSLNDLVANPWTPPAGKQRGAVNARSVDVTLNRNNLDDLYSSNINPITTYPNTGVIIWGQKTLLKSQSALNRINVRRLLINVRRSVRNVANTLLFEPNREETLVKFNSLVNPILQNIKRKNGVTQYKVVIDSSTTTQADVENNTIRGKIYLQPVRAIEFVALDFVVTNAGTEI